MVRRVAIIVPVINYTLSGARNRMVMFPQKLRENRKVAYWGLCGLRVGLNIDDVGWRVSGKILLESAPGAGQNPFTGIQTWDASPENMARKRESCDVAAGRTPVSL